jgi:hypothetical protein
VESKRKEAFDLGWGKSKEWTLRAENPNGEYATALDGHFAILVFDFCTRLLKGLTIDSNELAVDIEFSKTKARLRNNNNSAKTKQLLVCERFDHHTNYIIERDQKHTKWEAIHEPVDRTSRALLHYNKYPTHDQ